MKIADSTVLVTGSNRGIGRAFVQELVRRGAKKIYATARRPETIDVPGVVALPLDITDEAQVARVAKAAADTNFLINNAGISTLSKASTGPMAAIRGEMETNYFGTLAMVRAFAPVLAAAGGGAILNVLSVMAWLGYEHSNSYGASKAAAWALTNGLRVELAAQGTLVAGLVLASTDTDMMAWADIEKNRPEDVVTAALDGIENGRLEILADDISAQVKAGLAKDPALVYPQVVGAR